MTPSSFGSLGRRLPELAADLAALGAALDTHAPDVLARLSTLVERAVAGLCAEEQVPGDSFAAQLERLAERRLIPPALVPQLRAVHAREMLLEGDAAQVLVHFLEWRVGSRRRIVKSPPRRRRGLVLAAGAAGLAAVAVIAYVATRDEEVAPAPLPSTELVRIEGATYEMGTRPDERQAAMALCRDTDRRLYCPDERARLADEHQRTVTVATFELDRHEVTTGDFVAWLAQAPERARGIVGMPDVDRDAAGRYSVRPGRERLPAAGVTWEVARAYCEAIGKRLPTEPEWELAARGTERRVFPWGSTVPGCRDVVWGRRPGQLCSEGYGLPQGPDAVATSRGDVTPEGIHDLGGSVAEWTAERALRGGSWAAWVSWLRGAGRSTPAPETTLTTVGFRCARSLAAD